MPQNRTKGYQIYHSVLGMMLTLALILWVNEYYVLKVNIAVCLLFGIIPAMLIFVFNLYKKHVVSYIVLASLLPATALIFLLTRTNPISWLADMINWIMRYDRTDSTYEKMWAYTILVLLSAAVSILFFIIVNNLLSRLVLGIVIVILFIAFAIMQVNIGKVPVGIGIFYVLNTLIEFSGILYGRKTGIEDKKESILYLFPVCILLAAIAVGLPSNKEPIQWTVVKNMYYNIVDQINRLVTEWEFFVHEGDGIFSISMSGYTGDGSLDNENLLDSNRVALIVSGNTGVTPLYLTGSVSDVYTGHSWEKSGEDYLEGEQEYQMDYAELLYWLSGQDPELFDEYRLAESRSITVIYGSIKTKTFFYPSKCKWIYFDDRAPELNIERAGITYVKAKGSGTKYTTSYYDLNLSEPVFQDMLRKTDGFTYDEGRLLNDDELYQIEKSFLVRDRANFILKRNDFTSLFKKRTELIYGQYTQLPDSLPQRVKDLAYEITRDKETRYDKLKAIEEYLLKYEYNQSPGKVPEEADFVDYFLFENKKGYCTSFASAMVVMARSIGIPARYVEGYVVDYDEKNDIGYIVRNNNAHAWAEAYFDGAGWIPFEATPTLHESRYTPWAPKKKTGDESYQPYINTENEEETGEETLKNDTQEENKGINKAALIWIAVFAGMLAIILVMLVLYYLILRHRYRKDYDASDNSIKMYMLFLRILRLLRHEGFVLSSDETLIMLSERVKDRYRYEGVVFGDVINIFMAYRYGGIPVTEMQLKKVEAYHDGLMAKHAGETRKLMLYLEEFMFLIQKPNSRVIYQEP